MRINLILVAAPAGRGCFRSARWDFGVLHRIFLLLWPPWSIIFYSFLSYVRFHWLFRISLFAFTLVLAVPGKVISSIPLNPRTVKPHFLVVLLSPFLLSSFLLQICTFKVRCILVEWCVLLFWFHGLIFFLLRYHLIEGWGNLLCWIFFLPYRLLLCFSGTHCSFCLLAYRNICKRIRRRGRNKSLRWGAWLRCIGGNRLLLIWNLIRSPLSWISCSLHG